MNRNVLWVIIGIVVLVLALFLAFAGDRAETPLENEVNIEGTGSEQAPVPGAPGVVQETVVTTHTTREFTITGTNYAFNPKEIRVNKGDTVKINFVNALGTHDWKVEGYETGTRVIQGGQSDSLEFVADKAGTFEFYCSVGQHRANGMVGKLIVE